MIIPQEQLDAMPNNPLSNYQYAAIHHTACPSQNQTAQEISVEEQARGYIAIPYNFVIDGAGRIMVGRPIDKLPAATGGLNPYALAICFEGDFQPGDSAYTGEKPSDEMIHACVWLINNWIKPKCPGIHTIIGHRDAAGIEDDPLNATACPGDLLYARIPEIVSGTGLAPYKP